MVINGILHNINLKGLLKNKLILMGVFIALRNFIMLFKFDEKLLLFKEVKWPQRIVQAALIISIAILIVGGSLKFDKVLTEQQVMIIMEKQNHFSNEKLVKKIKEMNFQFPYIVYAQALLETGRFTSKIFIENNNIFGMLHPVQRITLSKGIQASYAYYNSWMDSLYDYGLYASLYLSKLKTEDDWYNYLQQSYAEDSGYVSALKNIILKENLKFKFN
jgi:hypothetical protein